MVLNVIITNIAEKNILFLYAFHKPKSIMILPGIIKEYLHAIEYIINKVATV